METVSLFDLLEKKNSYLLEFHKINTEELKRFSEGCFDRLEDFYYSREILLNAIHKLDDSLSQKPIGQIKEIQKSEKKKLTDILNLKRKMVMSILDQDLKILSLMNQLKENNIKDIAS